MDKSISLEVTFKPFSVQKINDQFTVCKCYVMALGKNRNLSHFTKESVDSALPTLFTFLLLQICNTMRRQTPGMSVVTTANGRATTS